MGRFQRDRRQGLQSVGAAVTVPVGLCAGAELAKELLPTRGEQAAPGAAGAAELSRLFPDESKPGV